MYGDAAGRARPAARVEPSAMPRAPAPRWHAAEASLRLPGAAPAAEAAAGDAAARADEVREALGDPRQAAPLLVRGAAGGWDALERWGERFLSEGAVGAQRVLLRDVCPPEAAAAAPEGSLQAANRPQALAVTMADAASYSGEARSEAARKRADGVRRYERRSLPHRRAFQIDQWPLFGKASAGHAGGAGPLTGPEFSADADAAAELRAFVGTLALLPDSTLAPGVGGHTLAVGPPGAKRALGRSHEGLMHAWHAQLRGRTQYVVYPPGSAELIGGGACEADVSGFDPSSPDWVHYPRARAATPRVATLAPGDVLLVPAGWWWHRRHLEGAPAVALRRDFALRAEAPRMLKSTAQQEARSEARRAAGGATTEEDLAVSRRARLEGNEHFRRGAYRAATDAYSRALRLLGAGGDDYGDPAMGGGGPGGARAIYTCNRAACWLKRRRWEEAKRDCDAVLRSGRADGIAVKALYRRAKALEGMGFPDEALRDLRRVLELEPGNKDAKEEVYIYDEVPTHARAIATNRKGHRAASYRDRHFGGDG